MATRPSTSPWRSGPPRTRSTPPASRHDRLCPDHPDYPLTSGRCNCMCSKCFQSTGHTPAGQPTGHCIHPGCPCHRPEAMEVIMYG